MMIQLTKSSALGRLGHLALARKTALNRCIIFIPRSHQLLYIPMQN